jgi:flavoprotein
VRLETRVSTVAKHSAPVFHDLNLGHFLFAIVPPLTANMIKIRIPIATLY